MNEFRAAILISFLCVGCQVGFSSQQSIYKEARAPKIFPDIGYLGKVQYKGEQHSSEFKLLETRLTDEGLRVLIRIFGKEQLLGTFSNLPEELRRARSTERLVDELILRTEEVERQLLSGEEWRLSEVSLEASKLRTKNEEQQKEFERIEIRHMMWMTELFQLKKNTSEPLEIVESLQTQNKNMKKQLQAQQLRPIDEALEVQMEDQPAARLLGQARYKGKEHSSDLEVGGVRLTDQNIAQFIEEYGEKQVFRTLLNLSMVPVECKDLVGCDTQALLKDARLRIEEVAKQLKKGPWGLSELSLEVYNLRARSEKLDKEIKSLYEWQKLLPEGELEKLDLFVEFLDLKAENKSLEKQLQEQEQQCKQDTIKVQELMQLAGNNTQ